MSSKPKRAKIPGSGRKKGTKPVLPTVREAFIMAFDEINKDLRDNDHVQPIHLIAWAKKNPTEFYKLAARLIPTELTGAGGGPIIVEAVNYAGTAPRHPAA